MGCRLFGHGAALSASNLYFQFVFVLFYSPPICLQRGGTLFRAYLARVGAHGAPARFARLIAPRAAQTPDAPVPPAPAGAFLRPQPLSCAEKRKGGPGSRLSSSFYHIFCKVNPL